MAREVRIVESRHIQKTEHLLPHRIPSSGREGGSEEREPKHD